MIFARFPKLAFSLRLRLLTSYLVLLVVTLGVGALALVLLIGARAAPPEPTYERLAALSQGLNYIDFLADLPTDPNRRLRQDQVRELLDAFASTRNVRTLHIRVLSEGTRVLYDSAGKFQPGDAIQLRLAGYKNERLARVLSRGSEQYFGGFRDPGAGEWLFSGVIFGQPRFVGEWGEDPDLWLLAEPLPTVSLQQTLAVFSSALAPPLLQAGIAGFALAIVLAALISRAIARPLQRVASGATAIARGDYSVRVPVKGPPEVRSLAESYNKMTAEVLAANIAQRDFLGNVSHDLKTPLTSIQGYAQAIVDGAAEDSSAAAQIIYEEASRLNRMVAELTDLEGLQAGKLSMASDSIDLAQLCDAVAESLRVLAEQRGVALETCLELAPTVQGDGDRLAQVLVNLISNAIEYTPRGGIVRVTAAPASGGAAITVRDTGIGIAPADLRRIFERFYQVDKARGPQRGTGLGLAIAREIVEAQGGRITASSAGPGQGAEFRVWLPGEGVA